MSVDRDHHPFHGQVQLACGGGDDPVVGLVRNQPVDLVPVHLVGLEGLVHDPPQGVHRHPEDFVALHLDEGTVHLRRHLQQVVVAPVRMQVGRQDAGFVARLEHYGARSVAEQHAGAAVAPVDDAGQHFGADNQDGASASGRDEPPGDVQPVDEPAADRLHVECRALPGPQFSLDMAGRAGEDTIGGGRRQHDHVDVVRRQPRRFQRLARRLRAHRGRGLFVARDVALQDPGAFPDPLIRSVDRLFQFLVRHHPLGETGSGPGDGRMGHDSTLASTRSASRVSMF